MHNNPRLVMVLHPIQHREVISFLLFLGFLPPARHISLLPASFSTICAGDSSSNVIGVER